VCGCVCALACVREHSSLFTCLYNSMTEASSFFQFFCLLCTQRLWFTSDREKTNIRDWKSSNKLLSASLLATFQHWCWARERTTLISQQRMQISEPLWLTPLYPPSVSIKQLKNRCREFQEIIKNFELIPTCVEIGQK